MSTAPDGPPRFPELRQTDKNMTPRGETFWREHQVWLESCGYMLRPRYRPGWQPSWLKSGKNPRTCEDGLTLTETFINDAIRISDGSYVALKILRPSVHPYEVEIGMYLSSKELASDENNHCVHIHDILTVPDIDDTVIMVMPLLRRWDEPFFRTVGEGVDFVRQLLQGVQFMHKHHVAHRDISELNILMDGSMYPNGWHPSRHWVAREDVNVNAKAFTRTERPPKYYLIDFGLSRRYDPNDKAPLEPPIRGGDKSVPEFQRYNPNQTTFNPFFTDIYYVGNRIREDLLTQYNAFGFLRPLAEDMVQDDPAKRPSIDEAISGFDAIVKKLSTLKLRSRVIHRDDISPPSWITHAARTMKYIFMGLPAIPTR